MLPLVSVSAPANAQDAAPTEYELKAAFLYKFAGYIEWPPERTREDQEFLVGVYGDSPFGSALAAAFKDKLVHGLKVRLIDVTSLEEVPQCHVLFVPLTEQEHLGQILPFASKSGVLTVTDDASGAADGAVIGFFIQDKKVRFVVNETAAERAQLHVSSKLLQVAMVIREAPSAAPSEDPDHEAPQDPEQ